MVQARYYACEFRVVCVLFAFGFSELSAEMFLMVNCKRLLSLTVYNPSGTYGVGAKLEVTITVVPGFKSMGDSVIIFA